MANKKKVVVRSKRVKAPARPKKSTSTAIFVPARPLAQQRSKKPKTSTGRSRRVSVTRRKK